MFTPDEEYHKKHNKQYELKPSALLRLLIFHHTGTRQSFQSSSIPF